jgi:hypothetical protein
MLRRGFRSRVPYLGEKGVFSGAEKSPLTPLFQRGEVEPLSKGKGRATFKGGNPNHGHAAAYI